MEKLNQEEMYNIDAGGFFEGLAAIAKVANPFVQAAAGVASIVKMFVSPSGTNKVGTVTNKWDNAKSEEYKSGSTHRVETKQVYYAY